jgi:translocation and assembly module TamB
VPFAGGQVDARAAFDTRPGQAGAELSVTARGLRIEAQEVESDGAELDLSARWDGARLDADATLSGNFGDPIRASVGVPLRPGPGGIPAIQPGGALDGSLAWNGQIGNLWAFVPAPGHILDGRADIDLRLGGTLDAPRLAGRADLTDGTYQNYVAGTILTRLTLRTSIAEDGTVRLTVDASDGAKGTVAATVALALGNDTPRIDAEARIDRAVLVRRDDVTGRVSGDLAVAGPFDDLLLNGRIHIDKAEVRLIGGAPPELVDLDGIRIKGAPEPETDGDGESRLTLDLAIVAERDIFVRGRGLDSEWKLDLTVTGDAAEPVITGRVEKVRGQLSLLGRPFDLVRGQVVFDGGRKIDPLLDVLLEREENDIRGGISVDGRASAPELHFVSTPALPEDEVMPRLLFGRSKQSLSGAEALQLVAGLATLTSGKAGPLDALRNAAGVDVLRVEGESAETATVTVGRNIAEGVFVGARQGLGEQGGAVAVEVEVFDGIVIDTEIGEKSGADIGITLRKDF